MPSINNLDITTALTAVENKIPNHSKYITTPKFNKLAAENFTTRLKQANVATKADIADFLKKKDFVDKLKKVNKRVTSNKSKHLLVENELKKLQDNCKKNYKHMIQVFLLVKATFSMMEHNFT